MQIMMIIIIAIGYSNVLIALGSTTVL